MRSFRTSGRGTTRRAFMPSLSCAEGRVVRAGSKTDSTGVPAPAIASEERLGLPVKEKDDPW